MNLSRIYASKIYLTSSRQDRIHAAIEDPMNIELVKQVADYLDDSSKHNLQKAISEKVKSDKPKSGDTQLENTNKNVFEDYSSTPTPGGHPSNPLSSGNVFDDFSSEVPEGDIPEGGDSVPESSEPSEPSAPAPEPSEPVEETTEITGVDEIDSKDSAVLQSGIIKKLLNDQEDTSGVVRVDIDDAETWIYYNDKVNLNDIFDNVIALLKDSKYDMLKFSRLARTDNAIVFDIKE